MAENSQKEKNTEKNTDQTEINVRNKSTQKKPDETARGERQQSDAPKNLDQESKSEGDTVLDKTDKGQVEDNMDQSQDKVTGQASDEKRTEGQAKAQDSKELFPSGAQSELLTETNPQNGAWSTQASESKNEKEKQASSSSKGQGVNFSWKLCNVTAGSDYIPCLDNEKAIKKLHSTKHYEHRERHCPEEAPICLVPLPDGYKKSIEWPNSRDKIWYHNVPHTKLAVVKGHQNWVKVSGEYLTFPGGGTQFKNGALHYIDVIQEALPDIAWGKRSRVVLDVGCGVASFGGYLFDRDVLTMSFAPKDEHEAQVQFALERGIPAISAVMGTKRLPYPGRVFDVVHCARCRVPWHIEGGKLLLELNRLLRPGGYFVWSATPVYQNLEEDVEIWKAMSSLMKSMCWDMVIKTKDDVDQVGLAIFRKPSNNSCYENRQESSPPFCKESDDPNAAWNVPLQTCMHKIPVGAAARGSKWPEKWPLRLETAPYWLDSSQTGVYGKPAPEDFKEDQDHWNNVVGNSYLNGMGIDWSKVRNVMDMRAVYGGFASALRDMKLWVMNIITIDSPDTLPIIYERGLFGMYHDWCESFSTYPRSYDLLHADHLFSRIQKKCKVLPLMAEVDRMLRPEGKLIVRDSAEVINEVERIAKSLNWEIKMSFSKKDEGILCVMKTTWRPKELDARS
ncbi:probable methyltransferase PMT26 [Asparagus officinalis]|nr:probable methyltransferase PMT26 [Asparagus officinalis]